MAEVDQNSSTDAFTFTDKEENINLKPDLLIDENSFKKNIPKTPSYFKRRFLLKSFTFLFIFNLIFFLSVILFERYKVNLNN